MIRSLMGTAVVLAVSLTTIFQNEMIPNLHSSKTVLDQKPRKMKNLISIVEIPTTNFSRAVSFYQEVFEIRIEEVDMVSTKLGVMPSSEETVNVVLVHGENYTPSMDGALLYFDAGEDLKKRLLSVEAAGGQVIAPKTEISPEMGFFAHFIDTEGNKIGLHGMK